MAAERVQRRLAAILAADVAGYSGLMEADEAGTLARLNALRSEIIDPGIAGHGGRIVKTMGDGVLVEFPSAVAAVETALAIQQAVAAHETAQPPDRRILFRIGINLGDVIIEGDDIHGDGVNVADRLQGLCRPGEVSLSGSVHDQVAGKLAAAFDDLGEQSVRNITRPVRVFRVRREATAGTDRSAPTEDVTPSAGPAVLVLPFENMSGDPEQAYFSDGITEDIITTLSYLSGLNVLARNMSFAFKGKPVDVREARRDLGVTHLVEGSVRRSGDRIRITAQLIDTATGHHVWAERYDRALTDVFAVQDEIAANIASALAIELVHGEQARRWRADTRNVEAWLHGIQARAHFLKMSPADHMAARRHLEQAVAIDPDYAIAWAQLAWINAVAIGLGDPEERDAAIARVTDLCDKAEALDRSVSITQIARGVIHLMKGEHAAAVAAGRRAIQLEDGVDNYGLMARLLKDAGMVDDAFRTITRAIRASPVVRPPLLWFLGDIYRLMGRKEDAIRTFRQLAEMAPNAWQAPLFLAVLYQTDDRPDEARAQIEALLQVAPYFSVRRFLGFASYSDPAITEQMAQALRDAGLPE